MANIKTYLNNIKTAVFGSEVRDSIHDAIQQCYDDASAKDNANMEVKMARGEYENLGKRLDSHSSQIKEIENKKVGNGVLATMGDLSQDVKEAMTGGSVAVVGRNSVNYENLQNDLSSFFIEVYEELNITLNTGYKRHDGAVTSDSGWKYCEIDVLEGQKYKITAQSWLAIAMVSFFDSNGNSVSYLPTVEDNSITNYADVEVIVPQNARKMVCNKYLSRPFKIEKKTNLTFNKEKIPPDKVIKTKLTIIGDSLSALDSPQATTKYHDLLAEKDNYIVYNLARGGHGYKRADDGDNAFWQQATKVSSDTDIVFIFGSFNDLGKVIDGEYTIGASVDNASTSTNTIMECVNKTITNIRSIKKDAVIVIASPTPWSTYHPGGGVNKDVAEQYVNAVKTVAHNQCCVFLDLFHESNIWSWNNEWNALYCTDGVHPNNAAHKKYLYPIIRDCLNRVNFNK